MKDLVSYCAKKQQPCIGWVDKYFKDCLCNLRDELSFGFGVVSLVCWGLAEIPQIITNFRTKSSHGVSLLFLLTWIAGDIFNLVGCLLEPATLPTQFYTAVLYTTNTVILVLQSLYYDHFYRYWKGQQNESFQEVEEVKKPLISPKPDDSAISIPKRTSTATARRGAGYGAFLATSISMPQQTKALMHVYSSLTTRRLLQEQGTENVYGQWLGWLMTAIYMGGRLPQIWLNIKRGSVEGLNPLMFIFALLANATYVASILVRSTAWSKIKANMPWLLDAAGCVGLDSFYVYYKNFREKTSRVGEDYGDYIEANNKE
ncbi:PQ-loop repeat family protein/transmembrane family protein [Forsythia ovata]|uniref:PQ-loop repeat family protein/transmembrane family protein n=1 Tax=Forsythia ovata TaxID=205694 RepID=A0ABD1UTY9_9LAMI